MNDSHVVGGLIAVSSTLTAAGLFLFRIVGKEIESVKNDLTKKIDEKADIDACATRHSNDGRIYSMIDSMNLRLTDLIQAVTRLETKIEFRRHDD